MVPAKKPSTNRTLVTGEVVWWQEVSEGTQAWAEWPGDEWQFRLRSPGGGERIVHRPARIPQDLWNQMGQMVLSPDAQWLMVSTRFEHRAWLLEARTGEIHEEWPVHFGYISTFSADNRRLLMGSDEEYRMWDIAGRSNQWVFPRPRGGNLAGRASFSPDGSVVAVAMDRRVPALLNAATGRECLRLEHRSPEVISRLVFSADLRQVAVLNETGVTHVWDLSRLRQTMATEGFGWPDGLARMGMPRVP